MAASTPRDRRRRKPAFGSVARALLTALGILLMSWGIGVPLVVMTGAETEGRITHVRRQLGDRNGVISNRYAFALDVPPAR